MSKPTMKSILENARAMRTASLSGRKKTQNPTTSTTPPHHTNAQNKSPHSITSQSLVLDQSQYSSKNQPYLSYQFNQPRPRNTYMIYPNTYQCYPNQSLQLQNMSQMSFMTYRQPLAEELSQTVAHTSIRNNPKQNTKERVLQIMRTINQQMLKNCHQPSQLQSIKNRMEHEFGLLRLKKQLGIVSLLEGI